LWPIDRAFWVVLSKMCNQADASAATAGAVYVIR